jgi:hypothetical protein
MKPDTSFVLKSGHFHLLTTFPVERLPTRDPGIPLRRGVEWRIALAMNLNQEGTGMKRSQSTKSFMPSTFWTQVHPDHFVLLDDHL